MSLTQLPYSIFSSLTTFFYVLLILTKFPHFHILFRLTAVTVRRHEFNFQSTLFIHNIRLNILIEIFNMSGDDDSDAVLVVSNTASKDFLFIRLKSAFIAVHCSDVFFS